MIKKFLALLLIALAFSLPAQALGQSREVEYYKKLKRIKIFESTRRDVESLFRYQSLKATGDGEFSKTVYYELKGAKLSVYYSTGRCSEHKSKLGFDVNRDAVIGADLFFYEEVPMTRFDFDLSKFSKYQEADNGSIDYTNEPLGIQVVGGEKVIRSIEFSGSEADQQKYRCK